MRKLKPLTRAQYTAKDHERCEASIPYDKTQPAQCRRAKIAGSLYCRQHDKMARERGDLGMRVFEDTKDVTDGF